MDSSESSSLYQQAIEAALDLRWEEALKINKKIIKLDPQNVDALNRQGKAYMELGKTNLARKSYSEVLKVDPYNPIALKNLKIMKSFKCNGQAAFPCNQTKLSPSLFLQEPGKTKIVSLMKVAEPQKLSQAFCGMKVEMAVKNRKITIIDPNGNYLGVLPDDINHNLIRLFKGGNKYDLFVKSIRVNSLSIIIKETFRSKRFKNQPSFLEYSNTSPATSILTSFDSNADEDSEEEEEQEL
ncbi:tetratricopeptide repeat protein [Patescibacteria group bacterium]|nr:tetratricopeptide repeat protein [Patescibacteria group bacterium]